MEFSLTQPWVEPTNCHHSLNDLLCDKTVCQYCTSKIPRDRTLQTERTFVSFHTQIPVGPTTCAPLSAAPLVPFSVISNNYKKGFAGRYWNRVFERSVFCCGVYDPWPPRAFPRDPVTNITRSLYLPYCFLHCFGSKSELFASVRQLSVILSG